MMRRFAFGSLVLMAVLVLAVGGVFAGEPTQAKTQTQTQAQTQKQDGPCYCYCQDGECPGCNGPCGECLECLQNRAGECFCWQGEQEKPVDPWEQFMWQWMSMWKGGE